MSTRTPILRWPLLTMALVVMATGASMLTGTQPTKPSVVRIQPASASTTSAVAGCPRWRVKWPKAAVYEKPTNISPKRAVKRRGQVVTGALCIRWTYRNKTEHHTYLAVKASKAKDKIGWIRLDAVRRI